MRRIQIDINRRNRTGQTPAPYTGPTPRVGEHVIVFEPEDGVCADAVIATVDPDRCTVALDVDWDTMRNDVLDQPSLGQSGGGPFILTVTSGAIAGVHWASTEELPGRGLFPQVSVGARELV
jgi:hypothetical protein